MKKVIVLGVFLSVASLSVSAQGFYFDIGLGVGKGWTEVDGIDMVDSLKYAGISVDEWLLILD